MVVFGSLTNLALEADAEAALVALLLPRCGAESPGVFPSSGLCAGLVVALLPLVVALVTLAVLVPGFPFALVLCGEVVHPSLPPSGCDGQCGEVFSGDRGRSLGTLSTRGGKLPPQSSSRDSKTFIFSAFLFFLLLLGGLLRSDLKNLLLGV